MKNKCPHDYSAREASVYAEGLCPICLQAENERLRALVRALGDRNKWHDEEQAAQTDKIERLQALRLGAEEGIKELQAQNERLHGHVAHRDKEIARLDGLAVADKAENERLQAALQDIIDGAGSPYDKARRALGMSDAD